MVGFDIPLTGSHERRRFSLMYQLPTLPRMLLCGQLPISVMSPVFHVGVTLPVRLFFCDILLMGVFISRLCSPPAVPIGKA